MHVRVGGTVVGTVSSRVLEIRVEPQSARAYLRVQRGGLTAQFESSVAGLRVEVPKDNVIAGMLDVATGRVVHALGFGYLRLQAELPHGFAVVDAPTEIEIKCGATTDRSRFVLPAGTKIRLRENRAVAMREHKDEKARVLFGEDAFLNVSLLKRGKRMSKVAVRSITHSRGREGIAVGWVANRDLNFRDDGGVAGESLCGSGSGPPPPGPRMTQHVCERDVALMMRVKDNVHRFGTVSPGAPIWVYTLGENVPGPAAPRDRDLALIHGTGLLDTHRGIGITHEALELLCRPAKPRDLADRKRSTTRAKIITQTTGCGR